MQGPTIDEIAAEFDGKVKVGKVDTDANREISMQQGITAIPTLMVFKSGELVKRLVGMQQKADLKAILDEVLGA